MNTERITVTDYFHNILDDGTVILYGGGFHEGEYLEVNVGGVVYVAYEAMRFDISKVPELRKFTQGGNIPSSILNKIINKAI